MIERALIDNVYDALAESTINSADKSAASAAAKGIHEVRKAILLAEGVDGKNAEQRSAVLEQMLLPERTTVDHAAHEERKAKLALELAHLERSRLRMIVDNEARHDCD